MPWIAYSINHWEEIKDDVKGFVLRILSKIVNEPEGFSLLNGSDFLLKIHSIMKDLENQKNCIILGYIDVINNLLLHEQGVNWIIDNEIWKDVIQFSLINLSIFVRRRSQILLSNLVITLRNNTFLTHLVFKEILDMNVQHHQLINAFDIQNPCVLKNENKCTLIQPGEIKLNLYKVMSEILLMALNNGVNIDINELYGKYRIQDLAWTEMHQDGDLNIILAASKFFCVWNISAIILTQNDLCKESDFSFLILKHLNLLIIRHLFPKVILETCVDYSYLWHKFDMKFDRTDNKGEFTKVENLIFVVQAMPMFIYIRLTYMDKNEVTELFVDKLFNVACPALIRLGYFYRDQCLATDLSLEKMTCQVINSFIRISSFCEKEQAVMIFQGFMHLLKEFVQRDTKIEIQKCQSCPENLIRTHPDLLSAILNGLSCYLTKFKFSWRDSLETVCMMSFIQSLITNPDVPHLICAEALKLVKLVLLNFMPPNLALLVDTLQGSSMRDLGDQLFKTLGSVHWEVRDSSLEVLQIIGSLAVDKFPAFQSLLLEHNLPAIILSIVESDCESYVRATALSCLSELIKIQVIWDTYLQKEQVLTTFVSLLYFETEGIVRNKAALLIKDICKHRNLSESSLEWVYDAMYHIAQNDLHWEVKISALDFWDAIQEKTFISVGMVDGKFPEVIFSKEKKKIVQITPTEVSLRVNSAMRHLSSNGCLYTLWETLHDDCDIQVQRKSASIIKKLMDVITTFKIMNDLEDSIGHVNEDTINGNRLDHFEKTDEIENKVKADQNNKSQSHDDVIDGIVAESDVKLLSGLVKLTEPVKSWPNIKKIMIPPREFLYKITAVDYTTYMKEPKENYKNTWDMESLLDDILLYSKWNVGEDRDKNCIDCY
ncbi:uncharacterized protein isoform X2 [Rhodnius prolixus]